MREKKVAISFVSSPTKRESCDIFSLVFFLNRPAHSPLRLTQLHQNVEISRRFTKGGFEKEQEGIVVCVRVKKEKGKSRSDERGASRSS